MSHEFQFPSARCLQNLGKLCISINLYFWEYKTHWENLYIHVYIIMTVLWPPPVHTFLFITMCANIPGNGYTTHGHTGRSSVTRDHHCQTGGASKVIKGRTLREECNISHCKQKNHLFRDTKEDAQFVWNYFFIPQIECQALFLAFLPFFLLTGTFSDPCYDRQIVTVMFILELNFPWLDCRSVVMCTCNINKLILSKVNCMDKVCYSHLYFCVTSKTCLKTLWIREQGKWLTEQDCSLITSLMLNHHVDRLFQPIKQQNTYVAGSPTKTMTWCSASPRSAAWWRHNRLTWWRHQRCQQRECWCGSRASLADFSCRTRTCESWYSPRSWGWAWPTPRWHPCRTATSTTHPHQRPACDPSTRSPRSTGQVGMVWPWVLYRWVW